MGPRVSRLDIESEEVREERRSKARSLQLKRAHSKSTTSAMVARVLAKTEGLDRKGRQGWDITALSTGITLTLVKFLAPELPVLLLVSATWHVRILEALDQAFYRIESSFALIHSNLLFFKNSFQSHSKIRVSDKVGMRLDRVISFEPLQVLNRHTIKLRCTYRFLHSPTSYQFEYKFDCTPPGKRCIWLHKDESKFNGVDRGYGYHAQIPKITVGQTVEIALTWYNLQGLLDFDSIEWQPPVIQDTSAVLQGLSNAVTAASKQQKPNSETESATHKLYHYNISRNCEAEYTNMEWFEAEYFARQREVYYYDHFMPFLRLVRCEFAGVDVTTSRNTYLAVMPGIVPDSKLKIGVEVEVKPRDTNVTSEVKRLGLLYDRGRPVELRVGDSLVLYISKGG